MAIKLASIHAAYDDHMGSDLSVVNAARQSFNKRKAAFDEKDVGLINFLATGMRTQEWDKLLDTIVGISTHVVASLGEHKQGHRDSLKQALLNYKKQAVHWAPFAHPHATISIRVPIFLARQLVKHQIGGTWSEESRRYITDEMEYYMEPVLHIRPEDIKQGSGDEVVDGDILLRTMEMVTEYSNQGYVQLLEAGVAPEEAREILTLNSMTGTTWTGSLLFWARIVTQRVDPHAQRAAQVFARQIDAIMRPLYPVSWQALVGTID